MGCIASQPSFIVSSNGTLDDYKKRYLETKTLGEGEFGVVKLAHDVMEQDLISSKPLAVKYLRKGFQFKDNTLYSPIKKETLVGEVEILRKLNGQCYNLKVYISLFFVPRQNHSSGVLKLFVCKSHSSYLSTKHLP
jgi:serine/threonine protein kinase